MDYARPWCSPTKAPGQPRHRVCELALRAFGSKLPTAAFTMTCTRMETVRGQACIACKSMHCQREKVTLRLDCRMASRGFMVPISIDWVARIWTLVMPTCSRPILTLSPYRASWLYSRRGYPTRRCPTRENRTGSSFPSTPVSTPIPVRTRYSPTHAASPATAA